MSDNRRHRVLVTDGNDGQSRSALAAARALGTAGYAVTVATAGTWSLAAMSRFTARRAPIPSTDAGGFAAGVRAELASRPYLLTFPASDGAMIALGDRSARFVDKLGLASDARVAGVNMLTTTEFDSSTQLLDAGDLTYPFVMKPREKNETNAGITEAIRVDDRRALVRAAAALKSAVVVQPFIDAPLYSIAGVAWKGRLVALVHQVTLRTWPVECGVSSAAETIEPELDVEEPLRNLLRDHDGVFQAQFLGDYLIDLNPRVYGSMPLATAAGANLPSIACQCALGRVPDLVRGRVGVRYRWLEGDLRHIWNRLVHGRLRRAELLDALHPRLRTAHSVESLVDPYPLVGRLRFAVDKWTR